MCAMLLLKMHRIQSEISFWAVKALNFLVLLTKGIFVSVVFVDPPSPLCQTYLPHYYKPHKCVGESNDPKK